MKTLKDKINDVDERELREEIEEHLGNMTEKDVDITYALRTANGLWLDSVTNFNTFSSEGYTGIPHSKHDKFWADVTDGSVYYRVHDAQDGWSEWCKNGKVASAPNYIDLIQLYYTGADEASLRHVYYRSRTPNHAGWLDTCCDLNSDSVSGIFGEPLDRLQCAIASTNPF